MDPKEDRPEVKVSKKKGALCELDVRAHLLVPPERVYAVLTLEDNSHVFRNVDKIKNRKVLEYDGNRKVVQVTHSSKWSFLWMHGEFDTTVVVTEDEAKKEISFDLAGPQGFMRAFHGGWKLSPCDCVPTSTAPAEAPMDDAPAGSAPEGGKREDDGQPTKETTAKEGAKGCDGKGCWATLQQVVEPRIFVPPGMSHILRGITAHVASNMFADLRAEFVRQKKARLAAASDSSSATTAAMAAVSVSSSATCNMDQDPSGTCSSGVAASPFKASHLHAEALAMSG
eukprot:jgi/Mesvir1/23797/Mv10610-RA.1